VSGNINQGLLARSVGAGTANLMVLNSVASYNSTGIVADGTNATVRIGQSGITGNTISSWANPGSAKVLSYGDNYIDGNGDGDPAPPSIARKSASAILKPSPWCGRITLVSSPQTHDGYRSMRPDQRPKWGKTGSRQAQR